MFTLFRQAIVSTLVLAVVLCGAYPVAVYLAGAALMPQQAGGSLITEGGTVVGSALIGQNFAGPEYFHGRPSAAGEDGYVANASSGSNYGPTSKALAERMGESARILRAEAAVPATDALPTASSSVSTLLPVEMLTASGSGLDPHISPAGALLQARRVAAARQLPLVEVEALVKAHTEDREWGLWGAERVNVLRLNLALRKLSQQ